MQRYILKRLAQSIVCLLLVSVIVFSLSRLSGDPMVVLMPPESSKQDWEVMRHELKLDQPIVVQYWSFVTGVVRGDFGKSFIWKEPALNVYAGRLWNTMQLAIFAFLLSLLIGIPAGIIGAVRSGTWVEKVLQFFAVLGQSIPVFWLGIMLILVFGVTFRVLPVSGMGSWQSVILPGVTLGGFFVAAQTRLTRSAMLDVLDSEYIKMLRVKGLPENQVIWKHALKNAAIPIITMGGMNLAVLLSGAVITETIFSWPGVGRLLVDAIFSRDFPVIQACVFLGAALFIFANLAVDIFYAYLDPRIRYQ